MRPERAKALYVLLLSTLLRLQREHHLHEITQGVATLYPGLCAFALTARLNEGCSVLNKLTLLTYQYETKQEEG